MAQDVVIDRAKSEDGPAIVTLLRRHDLPVDDVANHLATAFVARLGNELVGTTALEVYADGALLRSVAVARTVQGQGLGRKLIGAAIDLARALGLPAVYLLTTTAE